MCKAAAALTIFAVLCSASDRSDCTRGLSCLTEALSGVVDGRNCRFSLSRIPDPETPVEVYRNGVRLDMGEDYELSGSTIMFTNKREPVPGDVLSATYKPASRQLQPARSTSRSSGPVGGDEISSALARRALSAELARISEPKPNVESTNTNPLLPPATAADQSSGRDGARSSDKESNRTRRNAEREISAQGIDGLGDELLESDFPELASPTPSSRDTSHSAIQLLERRLKAQQPVLHSDDPLRKHAADTSN